jgi:hypothetical protein
MSWNMTQYILNQKPFKVWQNACVCMYVCMSLCMCACVCVRQHLCRQRCLYMWRVLINLMSVNLSLNIEPAITPFIIPDECYYSTCLRACQQGLPRIKKQDDLKSVVFWTEHGFGVGFGYFDGSWTSQRVLTRKGLSLEHSISGLGLTHSLESLTRSPCYGKGASGRSMFMRRILPRNRWFVARACSRVKPLGSSLGRVLRYGWNVPAISGHFGSPADLCFPPSVPCKQEVPEFLGPPPIYE